MPDRVTRETVDLSAYPDLIVIYLGMRVNSPRGVLRFLQLGKQIRDSVNAEPDGLLLHEQLFYGLRAGGGMRQYWRDLDSLEAWTRTLPHQAWWRDFLRDTQGTGFWHELYSIRGGFEAVYDAMPGPIGFGVFAPRQPARGRMFGARGRLARDGEAPAPVLAEEEVV
jgi:hypothetical protein